LPEQARNEQNNDIIITINNDSNSTRLICLHDKASQHLISQLAPITASKHSFGIPAPQSGVSAALSHPLKNPL